MEKSEYLTARGSEEPYAIQFSVFAANRIGQLRELLDLFSGRAVKVLGLSVVDSTDWAVIRLILSDANTARELLTRQRIPFTESQILLPVLDTEDALSRLCGRLMQAELNVHFAYPLTIRHTDLPVMAVHVDDIVLARSLLTRHGFRLLGDEDLADPT